MLPKEAPAGERRRLDASPDVDSWERLAYSSRPLDAALAAAGLGWPVFPAHGIQSDGRCSCGNPTCTRPGKHPRTPHGLRDAATDAHRLHSWWQHWPGANLAIRTGPPGPLVVDIDAGKGGVASWAALLKEHGLELHDTYQVRTGSGGLHLYYRWPASLQMGNSVGRLAPGIDIRAIGGYVIAPPSRNQSGKYEAVSGTEGKPSALLLMI